MARTASNRLSTFDGTSPREQQIVELSKPDAPGGGKGAGRKSAVSERRGDAEQERLERALTELFEQRISFNAYLGFRLASLSGDRVSIRFDMRPEFIGHYLHGRLHGGVISSVLDVAGGLAAMKAISEAWPHETTPQILERFRTLGTIDLRVDYLRAGIGETFTAEGAVVRLGRRIAATSMRLANEKGLLLATGNANYIVS